MTAPAKPPTWAILLAFGIIYTSWGTTYFAIKLGVQQESLPPLLFGGARLTLAGLILLGWQALRGQPLRIDGGALLRIFALALLLFVAGNGLISVGQKYVESSLAAVLVATTPLWIGLFALVMPHGERLSARGWVGLVFGLAGVVLLLDPQLPAPSTAADTALEASASSAVADEPAPSFSAFGVGCVLASSAAWAIGSLLLRRLRVPLPHLSAAGYQLLLGGASLLALGAAIGEVQQMPPPSLNALYIFLYLLLVGSLIGYVAFNWLLGHVSAAKVGTYAYVNPLIAVLIGWAFGEPVTPRLWAGIAVILAGVFLVQGRTREQA